MKLQRTVCKKHRLRIQEATEGENWEGYHSHIGWMVAQMVKNLPAMQETQVQSLGQEDPRRREWQPTQYSCLENPMERGVWWATVHGVTKSGTGMSGCHLLTHHSHGLGPSGKKICKNWPLGGDAGLSVKLSTKRRHRLTSHLRSYWVLHGTQVRSLNSGCTTVGND